MSKKEMTPAQYVFFIFGGERAVAKLLGLNPSTVWRWHGRIDSMSNHGGVPDRYFHELLVLAKTRGLNLTPKHLLFGT